MREIYLLNTGDYRAPKLAFSSFEKAEKFFRENGYTEIDLNPVYPSARLDGELHLLEKIKLD